MFVTLELNFIEWWMIRENKNLIEFLTNYTNPNIFADNQVIIGAFTVFILLFLEISRDEVT